MSDVERRDVLIGTLGLTTAALAATTPAAAGDASFMNNVPDPLLSGDDLPTFKFALEKSEGKVIGNSSGKEATVKQLPISKGIAGVSMRLEPGAMRELHWHATAAEWAFVAEGRVRTTVITPQGEAETNDFVAGDVWYFPRGHGHMLQCLGTQPCHFILIFDNGYFSESASRTGSATRQDRCWLKTSACRKQRSTAFQSKRFTLPAARFLPSRSRRRCRDGSCRRRRIDIVCLSRPLMGSIRAAANGVWMLRAFRSRRRSLGSSSILIQARCASCIGTPTQMSGNMSLMVRSPSPCLAHMAASVSKLWGKVTSDTFRRVTATRLKMWAISLVVS
jgi:quercetin dioxygenase-like cupin family protein